MSDFDGIETKRDLPTGDQRKNQFEGMDPKEIAEKNDE